MTEPLGNTNVLETTGHLMAERDYDYNLLGISSGRADTRKALSIHARPKRALECLLRQCFRHENASGNNHISTRRRVFVVLRKSIRILRRISTSMDRHALMPEDTSQILYDLNRGSNTLHDYLIDIAKHLRLLMSASDHNTYAPLRTDDEKSCCSCTTHPEIRAHLDTLCTELEVANANVQSFSQQ